MNDIGSILQAGLDKLIQINPGTLTYNDQSVTVFKSFLRNQNRQLNAIGYEDTYDDLYVLVKPSDIASWNLQAMKTLVYLDGVAYRLGRSTTTTPGYITLWLRLDR